MEFDEVQRLLEALAKLQVDVSDVDNNATLMSNFDKFVNCAVEYIEDDSQEAKLVAEYLERQQEETAKFQSQLQQAQDSLQELETEYSEAIKYLNEVKSQLEKLKRETSLARENDTFTQEFEDQIELQDKVQHYESILDQETAQVQALRCKIESLQEHMAYKNSNAELKASKNRLLYEFLSSALKTAIVNYNTEQVNLLLLSESQDTNDQIWHRLTVALKECNVKTCDYIWESIYAALGRKPHVSLADAVRYHHHKAGSEDAISNLSSLHL